MRGAPLHKGCRDMYQRSARFCRPLRGRLNLGLDSRQQRQVLLRAPARALHILHGLRSRAINRSGHGEQYERRALLCGDGDSLRGACAHMLENH